MAASEGRAVINEWAPLWASHWRAGACAVLSVAAAALPSSWRRDPFLSLLCLCFAAMAVDADRNVFFLAFVAAVLASRSLSGARPLGSGPKQAAAAVLAMGALCAAFALGRPFAASAGFDFKDYPERAVAFLDREGIEGRMFNTYRFGGYLLWRCSPRRKVFADGRNLVLDSRPREDGADSILRAARWYEPDNWAALDKAWSFDYAVVPNAPDYPAWVLDASSDWALAFWDDAALVYLKREPSNAGAIERCGYHRLKPNQLDFSYLSKEVDDPRSAPQVLAELDRSIQGSDRNCHAHQMHGITLFHIGKRQEAIAELEETSRRFPDKPGPLRSLGLCLEAAGDLAGAREADERAMRVARRVGDATIEALLEYSLGSLDFKQGRRDEAARRFTRCLKLMPDHPEAEDALRRLETQAPVDGKAAG